MKWFAFVLLCLTSIMSVAQTTFVAISVANADQTAKWYGDNLGFKVAKDSNSPNGQSHTVIVESPRFGMLEIIQHKRAVRWNQVLKQTNDRFLVHGVFKIGFFVDHLDDLAASLKKKNVNFRSEIFEDKPLKLRSFIIFDNAGNLVQFLEREP